MRSGIIASSLLALAVGFAAVPAHSQVFTPSYMSPRVTSDVGVYFSDGPGDFAVEGIWRGAYGGQNIGLRAGIADTEDVMVLVGGELKSVIQQSSPLELALTASGQGAFGDWDGFGFLLGLGIGHTFILDQLQVTPYVHPRVGLINSLGGNSDTDFEVLADFGIDARLTENIEIRFAFPLDSESSDWGVGFAWR